MRLFEHFQFIIVRLFITVCKFDTLKTKDEFVRTKLIEVIANSCIITQFTFHLNKIFTGLKYGIFEHERRDGRECDQMEKALPFFVISNEIKPTFKVFCVSKGVISLFHHFRWTFHKILSINKIQIIMYELCCYLINVMKYLLSNKKKLGW